MKMMDEGAEQSAPFFSFADGRDGDGDGREPDLTLQERTYFRADDNGGEPFHPLVLLSSNVYPDE